MLLQSLSFSRTPFTRVWARLPTFAFGRYFEVLQNRTNLKRPFFRHNTLGYATLPAHVNAINNVIFRAAMKQKEKGGSSEDLCKMKRYGFAVVNHPMPLTEKQAAKRTR